MSSPKRQSRPRAFWLTALVAFLLMASAGCHMGAGPQIGYRLGGGPIVGWEAGGGFAFVRANAGQTYALDEARPTKQSIQEHGTVTYLALEPWWFVGGTLGLSYNQGSDEAGFAGGVWEGIPLPVSESQLSSGRVFFTVAAGVRYAGGTWDFYFSPKAILLDKVNYLFAD